jgi:hypothetical protein
MWVGVIMPGSIDYKSPETESPQRARSLRTWLILLLVWLAGLLMWLLYLGLAAVVIYKLI